MLEIKRLLLLANKLIEKIPDPRNAKEHYESSVRTKNRKSEKQSEIITYQATNFENPNIVDIKSVITKHRKTLHKLSKAIKKGEKVGSNRFLYSNTKNVNIFWRKKSWK